MKIIIIVDANIIIYALLGGQPSIILFDSRFSFVTTEFTIREVSKYLPHLADKLQIPETKLNSMLELLPLTVYDQEFYKERILLAENMIKHIDPKDTDILALALKLESYLWSQDKHFDRSGYTKLLKTHSLI